MTSASILRLCLLAVGLALGSMLVASAWPTPRTMALFLGVGLPLAGLGMAGFGVYVFRDLRQRRAL